MEILVAMFAFLITATVVSKAVDKKEVSKPDPNVSAYDIEVIAVCPQGSTKPSQNRKEK